MATKKAKTKGGTVTWKGAPNLRVLLADGSTVLVSTGASFTPHPDWLAAVKSRQPAKFKLLK